MPKAVWRWIVLTVAMFVAGPLAATASGSLRAIDGGPDATALVGASPLMGLVMTLVTLALAAAVGMAGARLCSVRTGLFAAGLPLAWAAASGATVEGLIRTSSAPATLWRMSAEGVLLTVAGVLLAWLVAKLARTDPPDGAGAPRLGGGLLLALLLGAGAAWAVARSGMPGQVIAAGIVAGVIGTVVGRVVDPRTPTWAYVAVIAVLASAAPAAAAVLQGDNLAELTYAGHLLPIARLTPMDWLAGAFIGVPVGSAWAASLLGHKNPTPA